MNQSLGVTPGDLINDEVKLFSCVKTFEMFDFIIRGVPEAYKRNAIYDLQFAIKNGSYKISSTIKIEVNKELKEEILEKFGKKGSNLFKNMLKYYHNKECLNDNH
jgi:hypothetical protein